LTKYRSTVLIVDDDESMRDTLEAILQKEYNVLKAPDGRTGLRIVDEQEVHVVLLDLLLPDVSGLEILKNIKSRFPTIEVIMISAVKEVSAAVQAMKLGAFYYITKSFDYDEVLTMVQKVVDHRRGDLERLYLKSEIEQSTETEFIIGQSPAVREIHGLVDKVAVLPATILILGESGTGKQLLARHIHKKSHLADRPFVTVDLAAVPESLVESTLFGHEKGSFTGAYQQRIGKFELAHGGTLFLDEVGSLRHELQGKLLRALQEGEIERVGGNKTIQVNVRLISAANINLTEAVKKGTFREDLYYRLNVIPLRLPPLRERVADLPQLIEFFIRKYNHRFNKNITHIDRAAVEVLSAYDWPGNIRELENLVERLVAILDGEGIYRQHIPLEYSIGTFQPREGKVLEKAMAAFERDFLLKTLEKYKWNRRATAEALGISLSTLKYKLKHLNLVDFLPKKDG
jgi:two-component system response regulator AtoC